MALRRQHFDIQCAETNSALNFSITEITFVQPRAKFGPLGISKGGKSILTREISTTKQYSAIQ